MKPFDLEKAKAGAPVQTRDGRPARIICFDRVSSSGRYPLVAAFFGSGPTHEDVSSYTPEGRYSEGCTGEHPLDLVMAPVEREGWAIMDADEELYSTVFRTPEEARRIVKKCEMSECSIVKMMWDE